MNPLRLKFSLLFLLPAILLLGNTVPASTDGPVLKTGYTDPPLADFLNPDGTFNITPGFSGQVDISGYHIQLDECAGPVAAPDGMASATGTWATLGSGLNGTVNTIVAAANGDLYVGGSFTEAGGITANRIAKWDGANWSTLGSGLDGSCNALAIATNGDLYAGGLFSTAGGATVDNIAVWDGTNWSAVGSGSSVFACSALAIASDGTLYASGSWVNIGGVHSFSIASWDGTSWSALGSGLGFTNFDFGFGIKVASDGTVYVTGQFNLTPGSISGDKNIAKWDGASCSGVGTGLSAIGSVIEESPSGEIYVGGFFGSDNGFPSVTLNRIARFIPPVPCDIAITSVDKTDETYPEEDDGTITINASCCSCDGILYSIDGGVTTQTSPTFTVLMPGNYQP